MISTLLKRLFREDKNHCNSNWAPLGNVAAVVS